MYAATKPIRIGQPRAFNAIPRRLQSHDTLDLLEQFGTTLILARERQIHAQGDGVTYCWRVIDGCVRTVTLLRDGRRAVGEFLLADEYFGFDDVGTHNLAAEAVSDVVLRRYPRRAVEALAINDFALSYQLRSMALVNLHTARRRALMLSRKTAVERLSSFMLEMDRRVPGRNDGITELAMCRTDIADHLGLTTETVSRGLQQLNRNGAVVLRKHGFRICDHAALRDLAGAPLDLERIR